MKVAILIECPDDTTAPVIQYAAARTAQMLDGKVRSAYAITAPKKPTLADCIARALGFSPEAIYEITP